MPNNERPAGQGGAPRHRRRRRGAKPQQENVRSSRQNAVLNGEEPVRESRPPKPRQKPAPRAAAPAPQRRQGSEPPRELPKPTPRRRTAPRQQAENPALLLITRRPPKQKFQNFEEYITAHGGATAPIEGEEQELSPALQAIAAVVEQTAGDAGQ